MIEVRNLKKAYTKKNKKYRGIEDVSFVLPETGFIFVLGKSGSGKSTLLNLIGKLDDITSGEIIVEGKNINEFNEAEEEYYRSSYCGFIFQDYQLIDDLNVRDNIAISLEIKNDVEGKEEKINRIANVVEIEELLDKMPNELSGGQKQRVAIARALIKEPRLILCDEPTGNLDKKTSMKILELLKEISKTCLVFMVSHDDNASNKYADRRIIIEEGKVLRDEIRTKDYKNELTFVDDTVYLPYLKKLTTDEKNKINQFIVEKNKENKIVKIDELSSGFVKYEKHLEEGKEYIYKKEKLNPKRRMELTKKYLLKDKVSTSINIVLFALLTVLLILIQTFLSFSAKKIILDSINDTNQNEISISKIYKKDGFFDSDSVFLEFTAEEKEELLTVYKDEPYPVINYAFAIDNFSTHMTIEGGYTTNKKCRNYHGIYPGGTIGTVLVDEAYLQERFGIDGKLEVLAGSLEDCKDNDHLIITDFMADAMKDTYFALEKEYSYESLIGNVKRFDSSKLVFGSTSFAYIGCIIKTNYRETYKEIFDRYEQIAKKGFPKNELLALANSEEFATYYANIFNGELTYAYSLNKNFLDYFKSSEHISRQLACVTSLFMSVDDTLDSLDYFIGSEGYFYIDNSLKDDEIKLSMSLSSKLSRGLGASTLENQKICLIKTYENSIDSQIKEQLRLKVVGTSTEMSYVNENTLKKILSLQLLNIGYVFPFNGNQEKVIQTAVDKDYMIFDANFTIYSVVYKTIFVFGDIFRFLGILVCAFSIVFFIFTSIKTITGNKRIIGIFKSLGMPFMDIGFIFLSKNIVFCIASLILTSLLSYPFLLLADFLIIKSYESFFQRTITKLSVFYFHSDIFMITYIIILVIFIISSAIPFIITRKISPAKIVNNKSE